MPTSTKPCYVTSDKTRSARQDPSCALAALYRSTFPNMRNRSMIANIVGTAVQKNHEAQNASPYSIQVEVLDSNDSKKER